MRLTNPFPRRARSLLESTCHPPIQLTEASRRKGLRKPKPFAMNMLPVGSNSYLDLRCGFFPEGHYHKYRNLRVNAQGRPMFQSQTAL